MVATLVSSEVEIDHADSAAGRAPSVLTSSSTNALVIVFGALFVLGSWLGSPTQGGAAARKALAPTLRAAPGWLYGLVVAAALIYFLLAPTHGLRAFLTVVVLALFAAAGIAALRRQVAIEYPEGRQDVGIDAIREWIPALRPRPEAGKVRAPEREDTRLERLERLASLHERGVLSDEELAREKARVLGSE